MYQCGCRGGVIVGVGGGYQCGCRGRGTSVGVGER